MKKIAILFFIYSSLSGQNTDVSKILPQTPELTQLMKRVNYPVNHSTGLVDIKIPIYEISDGDITFPIFLSYHSSGIKVGEKAGEVGYGWSINLAPIISRKTNGSSDEGGYLTNKFLGVLSNGSGDNGCIKTNPKTYALEIRKGGANAIPDTQLDDFYYSLLNQSGRFTYRKKNKCESVISTNTTLSTKNGYIITYPFTNNLIEKTQNGFDITDDKGIHYSFGGNDECNNTLYEHQDNVGSPVTYYVKNIHSPTTNRKITFTYIPYGGNARIGSYPNTESVIIEKYKSSRMDTYFSPNPYPEVNDCNYPKPNNPFLIINDNNGRSEKSVLYDFQYDGSFQKGLCSALPESHNFGSESVFRNSLLVEKIDFSQGTINIVRNNNKVITSIIVKDLHNKIIKNIKFTYADNSRFLTSISMGDDENAPRYDFKYHSLFFPDGKSNSVDHWGYYTGKESATAVPEINEYIPLTESYSYEPKQQHIHIPGSDKSPDLLATLNGVLTEISYPTKGKALFGYELNKAIVSGTLTEYGGLRIRSIVETDERGNVASIKRYKYGLNESGGGYAKLENLEDTYKYDVEMGYFDERSFYVFDEISYPPGASYTKSVWNSSNLLSTSFDSGSSVVYPVVTEYIEDSNSNILGKTIYKYNVEGLKGRLFYRDIRLSEEFKNIAWKFGQLIEKESYAYKNEEPILQEKIQYEYELKEKNELETFEEKMIFTKDFAIDKGNIWNNDIMQNSLEYDALSFKNTTGANLLKKEIKTVYPNLDDASRYLESSKSLAYNHRDYIENETVYSEDGTILNSQYFYPEQGTSLFANNVLSPIIKTLNYKNNKLISGSIIEYNNLLPAKKLSLDIEKGSYNAEITFDKYDRFGNLLQYSSKEGIPTAIVWGYHNNLPIAKIEGAKYDGISSQVSNIIEQSNQQNNTSVITLSNLLRTQMPNYNVSTFTHIPLVGVSSITPPSGIREDFHYDNLGRLVKIVDINGKVVKEHQYQYKKGSIIFEPIMYENEGMSKEYYNQGCPEGYIGKYGLSFHHSIPRGIYKSYANQNDANSMAQEQMDIFGQKEANRCVKIEIPIDRETECSGRKVQIAWNPNFKGLFQSNRAYTNYELDNDTGWKLCTTYIDFEIDMSKVQSSGFVVGAWNKIINRVSSLPTMTEQIIQVKDINGIDWSFKIERSGAISVKTEMISYYNYNYQNSRFTIKYN